MSAPEPPPPGIPEEVWCKNRLQEYTQRASMPLPIYRTFNEGVQHAPQFRSQVWMDGTCFISPHIFSNRKMAEQDAAKHALIGIREKVKNEGSSRIREDTIFCKSIINEYAVKMNLTTPTYVTNESKAMLPMFVSSLVLNGVTFVGDPGRNKKEAEQFAARSAILSILESESSTTMSEIVKSKFKFYDALKKIKDSSSVQGGTVAAGANPFADLKDSASVQGGTIAAGANPLEDLKDSASVVPAGVSPFENAGALSSVNKRKEVDVSGGTVTGPFASTPQASLLTFPVIQTTLPESALERHSRNQATHQPLHEFKKHKSGTSSVAASPAPPIEFVPPASNSIGVDVSGGTVTGPFGSTPLASLLTFPVIQTTLPEPTLERRSSNQAAHQPLHEFKKPKSGTSSVAASPAPPIEFVPPASNSIRVDVSGGTVTGPFASTPQSGLLPVPVIQMTLPESTFEQRPSNQATHQPLHEFKRPKSGTSSVATAPAPPIEFVPPASEQAVICLTSAKKRNRKKKAAKKKAQYQSPLPMVVSQSPAPACSVAR